MGTAEEQLYWEQVAAIGQVSGAVATFLAVALSLYLALHSRRPDIKLVVGERLLLGGLDDGTRLLMFDFANRGSLPVTINSVGWKTGWFRRGPRFFKRKFAIQMTGGTAYGSAFPIILGPGQSASAYCLMDNILENAARHSDDPLFSRDWPDNRRRKTRAFGLAHTATGHTISVKVERPLHDTLVAAEVAAKTNAGSITSG
jgi:hypothetical protein